MTTTSGFQTLISWSLLSWLSTLFGWHPSRKPPWAPCRLELHRREGRANITRPGMLSFPPEIKVGWKVKSWHLTGLSRPQRRPKKYFRVDVKDFLINMFYPRLPGEGLSILSEVHPALLLLLLVPQLRVPDRSGHRRTSTTSSRCQSALSGLNASYGSLPHCRASTASARSQRALLDLNCEARSQWAPPDSNCKGQVSVGAAGPQPRAPNLNGHCRASIASSRSHWTLLDSTASARSQQGLLDPN